MNIQAPYKPLPKEFSRADIDAIYASGKTTTGTKILAGLAVACFIAVGVLLYFPVIH